MRGSRPAVDARLSRARRRCHSRRRYLVVREMAQWEERTCDIDPPPQSPALMLRLGMTAWLAACSAASPLGRRPPRPAAAGRQSAVGRRGQCRRRCSCIDESAGRHAMTDDTRSRTQMPGLARAEANGMAPPALDPRRWAALVVNLAAGFMDLLDVTIVNVAAPSILRDLHATYAQFEWVISAYLLGFAALLITGGRLGDIFGRKRMFLLGVAGFTVASALCGV